MLEASSSFPQISTPVVEFISIDAMPIAQECSVNLDPNDFFRRHVQRLDVGPAHLEAAGINAIALTS